MHLTLANHLSLSDRILNFIEKTIISWLIQPRERLGGIELAKNLGISEFTVGEEMKRLEGEVIVGLFL